MRRRLRSFFSWSFSHSVGVIHSSASARGVPGVLAVGVFARLHVLFGRSFSTCVHFCRRAPRFSSGGGASVGVPGAVSPCDGGVPSSVELDPVSFALSKYALGGRGSASRPCFSASASASSSLCSRGTALSVEYLDSG